MRRVRWRILAALAVLACIAPVSRAQEGPPSPAATKRTPPGRVAHVRVIGDLDNAKAGADVIAELERAKRERVTLVVLELESERTRADIAWEVGRTVRESPVPVAAFLHEGPGGKLSGGALAIGLLSRELFVRPRTEVREDGADDLRWMAPAEVSWERVDREMTGALWAALKQRGADQSLGTLLVARRPSAWCIPAENGPWSIVVSEPALGAGVRVRQIVSGADAATGSGGRVEIRAEELAGLGVAKCSATNVPQVIASCGRAGATRSTWTVTSDLEGARRRVLASVEEAKASRVRASELLDVRKRAPGRTVTAADYHGASREATVEIDRGFAGVRAADKELGEYPELLRRKPEARDGAAPRRRGRSAEDPVSAALTDLEEELQRLRVRAEDYARRK
jgi:hypothetical protein